MIPEPVMRELRYIEVYTAKKIRNLRAGPYTSPLRGAGFDFDEHQPYRPGDDVRRIDWNVTARMNAPYVRHTHAERELNVMIALDVSRSMELGTSHYSKKEVMTFIAGSLLFSAQSDQINTGFMAFADRVVAFNPPRRTRGAAWSVLEQCWSLAPQPGSTAIAPAIQYLARTLKKTSVVFLVSDFMTTENLFAGKDLALLAARHDVIAVVPEDPAETVLPHGGGYLHLRDLESGRDVAVALGGRSRRAYAEDAQRRREALARAFYRASIDHVFVPTHKNPVEPMLELFANRLLR
jgi:uncharacterized protein (DUF58 family)